MSFLDRITDFMRGSRKRAHARLSRSKSGKLVCRCPAYHFPHSPSSKKCHRHRAGRADGAEMARYFGKKPRKGGHKARGPYFKKPGISSPFHACVSKHMNAGMSLRAASKKCSAQRRAHKKRGKADGA